MFRTIAAALVLAGLVVMPAEARSAQALAQVSVEWARQWQAKNLDAVLALYTDDAVFINGDGSRIAGKPALKQFLSGVLKQYTARATMRSIDSSASGDLAYDWGDYSEIVVPVGKPVAPIETRGTYLVILKRVHAQWRIAEQMWTGDKPVPVKR